VHKPSSLGFEQAAGVPVSATTALVGVRAAKLAICTLAAGHSRGKSTITVC
jgi:NADPH:quinone reductase-like Zn-dependent oxidoreductase